MTRSPAMLLLLVVGFALTPVTPADAQFIPPGRESPATAPPPADYPSLAALALDAPVVADVAVRGSVRIKGQQAADLRAGYARFYLTGDVVALVRGPAGLPQRLSWLADLPLDARGRAAAPRKKARLLLFARTLPGRPAELQLTRLDGQQGWTPEADRVVRAVLTEALSPDAPPVVTGVANAFFVPGALPGEGETQVFLRTADGRPISLSVVRQASGERSWSVALSEVTAAAAPPPPRDTLLWYRLACSLPAQLPPAAAVDDDPANAARAREDYAWAIGSLGGCGVSPGGGASG